MSSRDPFVEQLARREVLVEGRLLTFHLDTVTDADGIERRREVVVHPGGVAIVALTDDRRVLLVRQYRHAVGRICLEVPAGTLDRDADGGREDPQLAARRELAEETGYQAAEWRLLARFFTAPGFTTEEMHLFLATDLSPAGEGIGPEADERLELLEVPLSEALALVESGQVQDAKTLIALLALARLQEVTGSSPS
ncbi:MAG TPA: NUDIX hydrolase [Candidatus Limnocylindrales bacterium]|nr:NUDIX hydrolase [Candidatus Limnocylindrales bacterium]